MGLQPTIFGRRPSNPFDNKVPRGHSDIIGMVVGSREYIENIFHRKVHFGGNADPNSCFLLERGMRTPHVRMPQICSNAKN